MAKAPKLDLGRLSYQDTMELTLLNTLALRPQLLAQRMKSGEPSEDVMQELERLTSEEFLNETYGRIRRLFARVVVELPRDWLVDDAPEVAWDDPEAYRYLRALRVAELRQMITDKVNAPKN